MTVNKRKKASRYRGHTTHGCGSMKKRRGAGNRGGRGNAGSGKRADQKKPSFWKKPSGKHGFTSIVEKGAAVNIADLELNKQAWLKAGVAKKEGDKYFVDLKKAKIAKLLGRGTAPKAWEITVDMVSASAKEKIENAGGTVKVINRAAKGE